MGPQRREGQGDEKLKKDVSDGAEPSRRENEERERKRKEKKRGSERTTIERDDERDDEVRNTRRLPLGRACINEDERERKKKIEIGVIGVQVQILSHRAATKRSSGKMHRAGVQQRRTVSDVNLERDTSGAHDEGGSRPKKNKKGTVAEDEQQKKENIGHT
ncbi:hypothetical protein B0H19DRAFT_1067577 [Mycena capillaripes]|nr:hypothetical protein B0H19DRAFT_1067577 [Mycena capillaripes]